MQALFARPNCACLGVVALLLSIPASYAGAQSITAEDILQDVTYPLDATSDGYVGSGAEFLLDEARAAEFVMVGERHGNRETPELMTWLLRELRPAGYEAYAVEVGPFTATLLESLARAEDPLGAFTEFMTANPFSVPFFWWRHEALMLAEAVELGYDIWGLDQEFVGSGRIHLRRLRDLAPDDAARALIDDWWQREIQGLAHYQETQSTREAIFFEITEEDVAELKAAFEGVAEAQSIVSEIQASARVYQLFGAGENYRSNHERIELMKRHLGDYLRVPGGPEPTGGGKVILKFGSVHGGRGYSNLNQLDLGNQIDGLASLRGGSSLNVLITSRYVVAPDGNVSDSLEQLPHMAPIFAAAKESQWAVVDLRALRPLVHTRAGREGYEQLADTAWAYDLAVVAPEFHATQYLAPQ